MSVADEIFSPDIQFHYPLGDLSGSEAVKSYIGAVRTAFPDIHFTVVDFNSEGDRVASRWSLVGSQNRSGLVHITVVVIVITLTFSDRGRRVPPKSMSYRKTPLGRLDHVLLSDFQAI